MNPAGLLAMWGWVRVLLKETLAGELIDQKRTLIL